MCSGIFTIIAILLYKTNIHTSPNSHITPPTINMRITALFTALCASTAFAMNVLQVDGTIKTYGEGDLLPRQFPSCCSNNFQPPCGCGSTCTSCSVSIAIPEERHRG
jgi:hypothetical protein